MTADATEVKDESGITGTLSYSNGTVKLGNVNVGSGTAPSGQTFANIVTVSGGDGSSADKAFVFTPNYGYSLSKGLILSTDDIIVPPTNGVYYKTTEASPLHLTSSMKLMM